MKTYKTAAGSILTISGKHNGIFITDWDWLEEKACIDCVVDPIPETDGNDLYLYWHCEYCDGGKAKLTEVIDGIGG